MTNYRVKDRRVVITAGVLSLARGQAAPRLHHLTDLGKGRYEVVRPVEFKAGEVFGYEGALPKVLADDLDEIESTEKAKAKAEKAAAAKVKSKVKEGEDKGGSEDKEEGKGD